MTKKIILSDENYYSNDANWHYMSVSQFKDFLRCEAAALVKLKGDWKPTSDNKALLVGNYVHSYFESEEVHEAFKEENKKSMYSSRKPYGLLKEFQVAEDMIEALKKQPAFLNLYDGEKERIITGNVGGVEWKGKLDSFNLSEKYFCDIKTHAGELNKKVWSEHWGQRVSWVADFGYYMQMAIYKEMLKQEFGEDFLPLIIAVSKQSPPDVAIYTLDENMMEFELNYAVEKIERINDIKNGLVKPEMCGSCEYCRANKIITDFVDPEE